MIALATSESPGTIKRNLFLFTYDSLASINSVCAHLLQNVPPVFFLGKNCFKRQQMTFLSIWRKPWHTGLVIHLLALFLLVRGTLRGDPNAEFSSFKASSHLVRYCHLQVAASYVPGPERNRFFWWHSHWESCWSRCMCQYALLANTHMCLCRT